MNQRQRYGASIFSMAPMLARQAPTVLRRDASKIFDGSKKDPPKETKTSLMWNFFLEYMESSSIHGFYHLTVPKRTPLEYLVWICLLGGGVAGAYVIGSTTLLRYQQNPTVISIEKNYQDWNTTFPAMTVCPRNTYDEGKLKLLVDNMYDDLKTREIVKEILIFLTESGTYETLTPRLLELAPHFPIKPEQYVEYIHKISFDFEYNPHDSAGGGFDMIKTWTELGTCYTYNSLVSIYNNYEYWKRNDWNISTDQVIKNGNPLDGEIFSDITDLNAHIKVFTHGYNDIPDILSRPRFLVSEEYLEYEHTICAISSTPETRELSVKQRRCRFIEESDLYISPQYSYALCRMQCRADKAVEMCGCAPHYIRYNPRSYNWPRCNITSYACLKKNSELLSKLRNEKTGEKVKCDCLPPCDDIAFTGNKIMKMSWFLPSSFKLGVTNYPRMRLKRDILFGLTDLFVSIGGTAGLFLGCSVLSFVEMFYYFTLRLFWFLHFRYKQLSTA